MKFIIASAFVGLALAGCSTTPATVVQTRVVEVVSSKPYRFITWTPADSAESKRQIRAHNRAHQAVIDAEKKAKP
jgi:hypothetical protein